MQTTEKQRVVTSFFIPALFLLLMWLVKIAEVIFDIRLSFLGVTPLKLQGLPGILLSPFLHGDWNHLMANSVPVFVLMAALYYFYRSLATEIMILTILLSGFWLWLGARSGVHIGASGLIYGLAIFLMFSGFFRRENKLMALSFVVIFLYGSLIWGIFPELFPEKNISWEGHLSGLITGLVLAWYYRKKGPQRKLYSWEIENDEEEIPEPELSNNTDSQSEKPYWDIPQPDKKDLKVVYRFKRKS